MQQEMFPESNIPELEAVVDAMCAPGVLKAVWHRPLEGNLMPSLDVLHEIMDRLRAAIFPGYYGKMPPTQASIRYHFAANLDSVNTLLSDQILRGICFACPENKPSCESCAEHARDSAREFLLRLPEIQRLLVRDACSAYEGDPAAGSPGETIFCYPSLYTMLHHRIAHELYRLEVPVIPRIISEMAHSRTGIDIHPGASIGEDFFIDHGTGVVIGETCMIGKSCRLYQGVTLGALSFPKNADGTLIKGIPRHPILEDHVTVYAGATILGRVTVGAGSIIGGNVWLTKDVPAGSKIAQEKSSSCSEARLTGVRAD